MSDYSNSATRQLLNRGNRFGRWMGACVAKLIEDLAGTAGDASASRTMIVASQDGLEVYTRGKTNGRELLARIDGGDGDVAGSLQRALKGGSAGTVLLRIAADRAVVKDIQLPPGAIDVLPAVVRNKIESLAAWPLAETLWGYRLAGPPKAGQLAVTVAIVSRKALDSLTALLRKANIKIAYLDIGRTADDPNGIAIDFLSSGRTSRMRRLVTGASAGIAVCALAVAAYGSYLAYSAYAELVAVNQRSEELRLALVSKTGTGETGAKLSEANKLFTRKQESQPVVAVLNDLTKLVPNGTWLSSIDLDGNVLTIAGLGVEIPKVIEALEKSEVFAKVNFASATQRNAERGVDVFSISAVIEPQGAQQ